MTARLAAIALTASLAGCAGPTLRPALTPRTAKTDAVLVLPGFGYGRNDDAAFRAVVKGAAGDAVDVYVSAYLTRTGLASSRGRLARFVRDNQLGRYQRLHVFAFLAGAWTLNPLADTGDIPNLASVTFDRSPYQERAPAIAADRLRLFAWLRFGSTLFDVARTPYPPLRAPHIKVGLMIETRPTPFIRKHEAAAREMGPFAFGCGDLRQRYDDCVYLPMNHDDLYARFADVWPEVMAFIRTGRFSGTADRTPPVDRAFDRTQTR
jgi:hypothetical protein